MKKLVISLSFMLFLGIIFVSAQSNNQTINDNPNENRVTASENITPGDVQVYYFHATRRCATCEAVEAVTVKTIKENYGPEVSFESINNEEDESNPLIAKWEVEGQTLLIIKGDEKVDLTNEAFLYARSKAQRLEKKLKATIDSML